MPRSHVEPRSPAGNRTDGLPPDFAARLRRTRYRLGLSQRQFAALLQTATSAVRRWERGIVAPPPPIWERVLALRDEQPARPVPAATGNLPLLLSSFVGRGQELELLLSLLARERLVTLVGPGGSGKTRLAIEAGHRALPMLPHGVWLVELAPLRDPALVPNAIAAMLQVREQGDTPLMYSLIEFLRGRQLLLLLDNCEHLVDACAAVIDQLLRACPELTLLATSREALGVAGEIVRAVPTLALPPADDPSPTSIARSEAVQLFVTRAAARVNGFALTDETAAAVARVCRRLDGLPLAIELAAARAQVLSPAQIAERLEGGDSVLSGGDRSAPERHQTLTAAIDWSFALLRPEERRCFLCLAVFAGSFGIEAAEAVCADPAEQSNGTPVGGFLEVIARLTAQSLVVSVPNEREVRFRLLETLRAYARARLEATGDYDLVQRRHADYYHALAGRAEPELDGPNQASWLDRLDTNLDDLRAALRFLVDRGEFEAALGLAISVRRFWEIRGHLTEGIGWLKLLLAQDAGIEATTHARALTAAGFLTWKQGDPSGARPLLEEALSLWRELGDKLRVARCLLELGAALQTQEDMAAARPYYEESLALSRELGDELNVARLHNNLSMVASAQGHLDDALHYAETSIELNAALGNQHGRAIGLSNLAEIRYFRGDLDGARTAAEEALAFFRTLGNLQIAGVVLTNLALFALAGGEYGQAAEHAEAALALQDVTQDRLGGASAHERLALAHAYRGEFAGAVSHLHTALLVKRSLGYRNELARGLESAALIGLLSGLWTRAARLFGAADAIREATRLPLSAFERGRFQHAVKAARLAIGEAAFEAALRAGRLLTSDEAIAEGLTIGTETAGPAESRARAAATGVTPFTEREAEVLRLLAAGRSNKEIAHALLMSVRTVERHVTNAYGKIGVSGRADAISYVLRHGLVDGSDVPADR